MNEAFRLSRIKAPRGTLTALILLALVFIVFGVVVSTAAPEHAAVAPHYFDDHPALTLANWMLGRLFGQVGA